MQRQFAAGHSEGVSEGHRVGVDIGLQSRIVHQATDGKVGKQQTVELLKDEIAGFAPEDDLAAP